MSEHLKKKIQSVRDEYDEDSQRIMDKWLTDLSEIEGIKELSSHMVIQSFMSRLRTQIEGINRQLQEKKSKDLPDKERDGLLDRKILFQNFISIFEGIEAREASILRSIEDLDKK
jgi:hypothetical protein